MRRILPYLVIVAITLATIPAADFALRLLYAEDWARLQADFEDRMMFNSGWGYGTLLQPNRSATFQRPEEDGGQAIVWRTNSLGLRGPEIPATEAYRILVYGDSNLLARFSELEDSYSQQLESRLNRDARDSYLVLNAGVAGHGPDQYLLRLERDFPRLQPDAVVFHLYAGNDFGDLIRNAFFYLKNDGTLDLREVEDKPEAKLGPLLGFPSFIGYSLVKAMTDDQFEALPETEARLLTDDSLPMSERQLRVIQSRTRESHANYLAGKPSPFDYHDVDVATDPLGDTATLKAALMKAVLAQAKKEVESLGAEFFVVVQPSKVDLSSYSTLNAAFLSRFPLYAPSNLSDRLAQICEELGIRHFNLYPTLAGPDAGRYFFKADGHWNDEGQALAARAVADWLAPALERKP